MHLLFVFWLIWSMISRAIGRGISKIGTRIFSSLSKINKDLELSIYRLFWLKIEYLNDFAKEEFHKRKLPLKI